MVVDTGVVVERHRRFAARRLQPRQAFVQESGDRAGPLGGLQHAAIVAAGRWYRQSRRGMVPPACGIPARMETPNPQPEDATMAGRRCATVALLAFAACAATPVAAVSLVARGLGQALVYPYYTVNESQDTLVTVVNASETGKAVAVRFSESYNGRTALAFMLYLSPRDTWTAVVTQDGDDGAARLKTRDGSCARPTIPVAGLTFSTHAVTASPDGGPTTPSRTREGMIELIAAADLVPGSPTAAGITHLPNGGMPMNCSAIRTDAADYAAPTNGLSGTASIVNVGEGTFFGYEADALAGFTDVALAPTLPVDEIGLHLANSAESPSGGARATVIRDDGRAMELDYARGIDAVSAVYLADRLYNEFLVAPSLGASTDWVVTFPTKRWYVDAALEPSAPRPPFTARFDAPGVSDVVLHAVLHDQEEGHSDTFPPEDGCGFICPDERPFTLSHQTNVVRVRPGGASASASDVLGSRTATTLEPFSMVPLDAEAGWIEVELAEPFGGGSTHALPDGRTASGDQVVNLHGLPVTGFMVYSIVNANAAPGRLANYEGAFAHRTHVGCDIRDGSGAATGTCD
ncbi:MAG TPA: hypothetical protein VF422_03580 [Dokdonella sp.]